jgi:iron complex transport system substrate-binding protein
MRVITLLPAATEIVAALGGADQLVGISHECDYPSWVRHLPRVTATPVEVHAPGRVIDEEVRRLRSSGRPVIAVDADQLATLAPDLIITQELCEVCAVSDGEVRRLAVGLPGQPTVMSLAARNLDGIWSDIAAVGRALDLAAEAEELVLGLQSRLRRLERPLTGARPEVLCIEWLDPPYLAGHWVPELVAAAGGRDIGAEPGSHSALTDWKKLNQLRPDHIVIMPCGFGVERSRTELEALDNPDALELMRRTPTWIIDGNSYTSRPGPRVVDGAARIQSILLDRSPFDIESWQSVAC